MNRTTIAALGVLLTACTESAPQAPVQGTPTTALGPCAADFVEVTATTPACGITLGTDGSLTIGERHYPPIAVSYEQNASGQTAIPAKRLILFPPAPKSGSRILQACDGLDSSSLCWAVRLMRPAGDALLEIGAGKYGPQRWISWSPEEHRVALLSSTEGFDWLHVIETDDGTTRLFPNADENANWIIDRATFTWHGDDAFSVEVKECESCAPVERSFNLP
jgi:hypothetical protein